MNKTVQCWIDINITNPKNIWSKNQRKTIIDTVQKTKESEYIKWSKYSAGRFIKSLYNKLKYNLYTTPKEKLLVVKGTEMTKVEGLL